MKIIRNIGELKRYFDLEREKSIGSDEDKWNKMLEIRDCLIYNVNFSSNDLKLINEIPIVNSVFYKCSFGDKGYLLNMELDFMSRIYFINCTFNLENIRLQPVYCTERVCIGDGEINLCDSRGVSFIESSFASGSRIFLENVPTSFSFIRCRAERLYLCSSFYWSRIYIVSSVILSIIVGYDFDRLSHHATFFINTLHISNSNIGSILLTEDRATIDGTGVYVGTSTIDSLLSDNINKLYIGAHFSELDLSGRSFVNAVFSRSNNCMFHRCNVEGLDLRNITIKNGNYYVGRTKRVYFKNCLNVDKMLLPDSAKKGFYDTNKNFYYIELP